MFLLVLQRLAIQCLFDVIMFPVWWYTRGLARVSIGLWHALEDANANLAPFLWLRHIFTPMYGQRDLQGRLMSFFMRTVNIIGRSIALCVYVCLLCIELSIWILLPVGIVYMIIRVLTLQ